MYFPLIDFAIVDACVCLRGGRVRVLMHVCTCEVGGCECT